MMFLRLVLVACLPLGTASRRAPQKPICPEGYIDHTQGNAWIWRCGEKCHESKIYGAWADYVCQCACVLPSQCLKAKAVYSAAADNGQNTSLADDECVVDYERTGIIPTGDQGSAVDSTYTPEPSVNGGYSWSPRVNDPLVATPGSGSGSAASGGAASGGKSNGNTAGVGATPPANAGTSYDNLLASANNDDSDNTTVILASVLGATALLLCCAAALFFVCRSDGTTTSKGGVRDWNEEAKPRHSNGQTLPVFKPMEGTLPESEQFHMPAGSLPGHGAWHTPPPAPHGPQVVSKHDAWGSHNPHSSHTIGGSPRQSPTTSPRGTHREASRQSLHSNASHHDHHHHPHSHEAHHVHHHALIDVSKDNAHQHSHEDEALKAATRLSNQAHQHPHSNGAPQAHHDHHTDAARHAAATRIQAAHRGNVGRQKAEKQKVHRASSLRAAGTGDQPGQIPS